ncbi:SH3 domain-binding protein 4-A-like isoform X2 [Pseudoliparis swirei]|uniref:SH3 domain-binding protein 4-A-like isoform X2 n=1 Tax=Pseudoliparis swirei TaxID=2059687 RepID=UPI0024BEA984|nr:SH3 domain-binding protein 4-A-like isoform X2 [Pseudoliparis swirei]
MAAHRIVRVASGGRALPRCRSEGTLIDLGQGVTDAQAPPPPSASSPGAGQEVVAVKDYRPSSFTTLSFSKGDRLLVLDTSGGEWWYAHNHTEMGYIPAAYVRPLAPRPADGPGEGPEDGSEEAAGLGEWTGNPFMDDLILFDAPPSGSDFDPSSAGTKGSGPTSPSREAAPYPRGDNPFLRSQRCRSLSELSPPSPSGFFTGLKAPSPEQFQSREDFRTAWLDHRKLARSCHDLASLGQSPGWGQTQPVETSVVCRLDSGGGVVQLPDTRISIHVPEGHVGPGAHQQVSMKALLDPPLELNGDHCSTVSPVLEITLSNMETRSSVTLEMSVAASLRTDGRHAAEVLCVRSARRDGPYAAVPNAYLYGDTIQVQLGGPEPRMYVAVVVRSRHAGRHATVWDLVQRTVTLGVYGPKHVHPAFRAVVALFGHDCPPTHLLLEEAGPPAALRLWGKQRFALAYPQDLQVGLYSNMSNHQVSSEGAGAIRGLQVKLGKVSRLLYTISSPDLDGLSDFTLRVQVKDALDCILTQFCVQTPPPPPAGARTGGQRRFLRRREVDKIVLSPLAVTSKYPKFQDRRVTNLKFGKLLKTVLRPHRSPYLLEYRRGDVIALLSEERLKLRGQLRTKEWYIGFYQGRLGLVHANNVLVLGKVKPVYWRGPDLGTAALLEQILKPCRFLTYIYASVRTALMENVGSWRALADALGNGNLPLDFFCRSEPDHEPEKVASVLEKLKEECTSGENKERKSFQRELVMGWRTCGGGSRLLQFPGKRSDMYDIWMRLEGLNVVLGSV